MSPKLPRITAVQLARALRRDGWQMVRQTGSHAQYKHASKPGLVTVPRHAGGTIKPPVLQSVLDRAGLTPESLRRLL